MSCITKIVLTEPLIDSVTKANVIADSCKILDINLKTVKQSDLDFVCKQRIVTKRKEKLHAFVAWFDCMFNATEPRITLSTSPFTRYTHWKHTILQQPAPLSVFPGDVIHGAFAAHKSSVNPREIDIKMSVNLENSREKVENQVYN